MEQKGKLVVISGFSGAGKGTLMKALLAQNGFYCALYKRRQAAGR